MFNSVDFYHADLDIHQSNFLTMMSSSLTLPPTSTTELATGCLMDFCKGAAVLSPDLENTPLYTYAADLAIEMHVSQCYYRSTSPFKCLRRRIISSDLEYLQTSRSGTGDVG